MGWGWGATEFHLHASLPLLTLHICQKQRHTITPHFTSSKSQGCDFCPHKSRAWLTASSLCGPVALPRCLWFLLPVPRPWLKRQISGWRLPQGQVPRPCPVIIPDRARCPGPSPPSGSSGSSGLARLQRQQRSPRAPAHRVQLRAAGGGGGGGGSLCADSLEPGGPYAQTRANHRLLSVEVASPNLHFWY